MDTMTTQYQNGIGVSSMLNKIQYLAMQRIRPVWDLFLVNIETIVRDQAKSDNVEDIVNKVIVDCQTLVQYFEAYCTNSAVMCYKVTPLICFYFGHYKNIPQAYLREKLPKGTEERIMISKQVMERLKVNPLQSNSIPIFVYEEGLEKGVWPHIELLKDLHETKINNQPITDLQYRKVLLISHIPLDFDLYTRFAEFTLLESYTGNLKSVRQFGKKVFNNENIPFNKYTHLLFGDKWYLKSPLSRKDKQNILAQAEKEQWFIISLKDMRTKLINILPNLTSWFTTPDI